MLRYIVLSLFFSTNCWSSVFAQYQNCTGSVDHVADGFCDSVNNNAGCGYDGGDCCECTCVDSDSFICGFWGFDCRDPDAADPLHDCEEAPVFASPCPTEIPVEFVVEDTASAMALAEALQCSGGSFNVVWKGDVVVNQTIYVANGTLLNITGADEGGGMEGGTNVRPFAVVDASLYMSNMRITDGYALAGGAISVSRSRVSFDHMSFENNTAKSSGGALHISGGSIVSWSGMTEFVGNGAGSFGGVLYADNGSILSWSGSTIFSGNTATYGGGAVYIAGGAEASWEDTTLFSNNLAGSGGGAMFLVRGSSASWEAETSFVENLSIFGGAVYVSWFSGTTWGGDTNFVGNWAQFDGGAFSMTYNSEASWSGETTFSMNTALFDGGAMSIDYESEATWEGRTAFSGNIAGWNGGALNVDFDSRTSWIANTTFSGNTAEIFGGALSLDDRSLATWGAETIFSKNIAQVNGGAVSAMAGSSVSWGAETTFSGNSAEISSGGALSLFMESMASWEAKTTFLGNTAGFNGGALSILNTSVASWDAETTFLENTCGSNGGALSAYGRSNVSWKAETTFSRNTAGNEGGGIGISHDSIAFWQGLATFSNNVANNSGGAFSISSNSSAQWHAETLFLSNSASSFGGAAQVRDSSVARWEAETDFSGNIAEYGGALDAEYTSEVFWKAPTTFVMNEAGSDGGAVHVAYGSNLACLARVTFLQNTALSRGGAVSVQDTSTTLWGAETNFSHNVARSNGGAVYLSSGSSAYWSAGASFFNNAASEDGGALYSFESDMGMNNSVVFLENKCGGSGGAMAITTGSSVAFRTESVTFYGNAANVAGGAALVSGIGLGPQFTGFRFVSNLAQIGGAVYITSSGTAITKNQGRDEEIPNPTVFERCEFVSNEAGATGGAVDSSAGLDSITDTSFVGNTARVGGALRLAGTTSVTNCSFVENSSREGEGSAVSNIGHISEMSHVRFEDNVFMCDAGTYLSFGVASTSDDSFEVVCDGCVTDCIECVVPQIVPECNTTMKHSISAGGNVTLETLHIEPGYWRATSTSTEVFKCYNQDACLGGFTGAPGYCLEGYEGPYCSVCSDGYTSSLGFACNECLEDGAAVGLIIVVVFLALFAFFILLYFMGSGVDFCKPRNNDGVVIVKLRERLQSMKIIIIAWQILTQFTSAANVVYPGVYQRFLNGIDVLNFDLTWILSAGCIVDVTFHDRLLMSTIGPVVVLGIFGVSYAAATRINREYHEILQKVHRRHLSMVFLLTFLVYSPVSSVLFQMFACDELHDGKIYLRADYRIECDSPEHEVLQVYAVIMMLLYTAGIPAVYAAVLYRNREILIDQRGRQADAMAQSVSSLWELYKPDKHRIYYELVECARRILVAGLVVFIYPNTAAQVAIALMLGGFFMLVSEAVAPYARDFDAWVSRLGHAIVCTSMFLALLLKVDVTDERARSQRVYESILVFSHACMVVAVLGEAAVLTFPLCMAVQEEVSLPRVRHGARVVIALGAAIDD